MSRKDTYEMDFALLNHDEDLLFVADLRTSAGVPYDDYSKAGVTEFECDWSSDVKRAGIEALTSSSEWGADVRS